jgi:short-subunit dehydrogenase
MQQVGVPDVVIANAGISGGTLSEEFSDVEAFEQILRTNVLGVVNTFQPFMKGMLGENRGTFVGVSSIAGVRGLPGSGAYSASKAALTTYLESLRVELHDSGVNVLTVCPGYIKTPMTDVNQFHMPFLMNSDDAADSIIQAIKRNKATHVMPWQMKLVASCMKWLPRVVYDRLASTAPRKPKFTR